MKLQARRNKIRAFSAEIAEGAGAVPLGDTATSGGPQQFEVQQGLDFRGSVAVDLAAEANFFKIRAGPDFRFHVDLHASRMKLLRAEQMPAQLVAAILGHIF